ncbi:MAG: YtxH domain-containing protein [Chitinophagales bacterium]
MNAKQIAMAFMAGLAAGAAIGILFAPEAGNESRTKIKEKAGKLGEFLKRKTDELRGAAEDLADQAQDMTEKVYNKSSSKVNS